MVPLTNSFNIRRFDALTIQPICEFLYADDCGLLSHSRTEMQHPMDTFTRACTALGMTINLKKTVVMYQTAPGKTYIPPSTYVYANKLKVADRFVYVGTTLSSKNTFDNEIALRICKASESFGRFDSRLWKRRGISVGTKLKVYKAFVLSSLLYASETWVFYKKDIKRLERIYQQRLRRILGIK